MGPVYLPPYSPDFNPIERLWQHLNSQYLAGYLTRKSRTNLVFTSAFTWFL
ncbi:transposase [Luteolibacter pohnpeiensis]|uniref:Transposase n=1 Tax=Luteolibacter pohnpeiensis TaxID=454153 RepID=A0A934VVF9_9BACT|nr:transposase [Luteolibacter pohnpeiensis]